MGGRGGGELQRYTSNPYAFWHGKEVGGHLHAPAAVPPAQDVVSASRLAQMVQKISPH